MRSFRKFHVAGSLSNETSSSGRRHFLQYIHSGLYVFRRLQGRIEVQELHIVCCIIARGGGGQVAGVLVLADDLTGAGDTGLQFSKSGCRTTIYWSHADLSRGVSAREDEVFVYNMESRSLPSVRARQVSERIAAEVDWPAFRRVYKKIDSTMRGHIGMELEIILQHASFELAVVAPAYPANGRTTVGGNHYLHGVPLAETDMAKDPVHPVRHSSILAILRAQTSLPAAAIELEWIRSGSLAERVEQLRADGARIVVLDAVEQQDLHRAYKQLRTMPHRIAWTGSAGLAQSMAKTEFDEAGRARILTDRQPEGTPTSAWSECTGRNDENVRPQLESGGRRSPVLVAAGSMSPVTSRQAERLKERLDPTTYIEIPPLQLLEPQDGYRHRALHAASRLLIEGRDVVLRTDVSDEARAASLRWEQASGFPAGESSRRIARAMGEWVSAVIRQTKVRHLVLTGGDIAYQVLQQLGVTRMEIVGEVEEGLPLCVADDPSCTVVTKAGAFGTDQALVRAMERVQALRDSI